jgi:uncharacterized protein YebE (UPF0316 family)
MGALFALVFGVWILVAIMIPRGEDITAVIWYAVGVTVGAIVGILANLAGRQ